MGKFNFRPPHRRHQRLTRLAATPAAELLCAAQKLTITQLVDQAARHAHFYKCPTPTTCPTDSDIQWDPCKLDVGPVKVLTCTSVSYWTHPLGSCTGLLVCFLAPTGQDIIVHWSITVAGTTEVSVIADSDDPEFCSDFNYH